MNLYNAISLIYSKLVLLVVVERLKIIKVQNA